MINDWENAILLPTSFGSMKRKKYNTNQPKKYIIGDRDHGQRVYGQNVAPHKSKPESEMLNDPWKNQIACNKVLHRTEEVTKDYGLLILGIK